MGLIAYIRDTAINTGILTALVERFKNDNASARIFNPPGVDSRPLDNDICFTQDSEDTEGGKDITGFIDPKNPPVAEKGEHRTYARDAAGNIVATMYLKKDGKVHIDCDSDLVANVGGKTELNSVGDVTATTPNFNIIGKLNVTDDITCEKDVIWNNAVSAISGTNHPHFPGNLGFNTGAPLPTASPGVPIPSPAPSYDANKNIIDGNGTKSTEHIHSQGNDSNGDAEVDTGNAQ